MATVKETLEAEKAALQADYDKAKAALDARMPQIEAELASGESYLAQEAEAFKAWIEAKYHSFFPQAAPPVQ
jgi:hypothetical protein